MKHFPIYLAVEDRKIVVSGGGDAALAKLRLLLKTEAKLVVFAADPAAEIKEWAQESRLTLYRRALTRFDLDGAALIYAADEDPIRDAQIVALATEGGHLVNVVDNLEDSAFITPAIVDRDPVTVAIGTEGAAPVLARAIKARLEEQLPQSTGVLARLGKAFRPLAEKLPFGRARRDFWADYYFQSGPAALEKGGNTAVPPALETLLQDHLAKGEAAGRVDVVGAGPGDPDLLTMKARRLLDEADVVIHDRLVSPQIMELARREAHIINVGKTGFGPSTPQEKIHDLMIEHARAGAHVVRLKGGDPGIFGRLDEELDALTAAGIDWRVVPGITAASAAVAQIGQSLTKRGRNASARLLTGHDVKGFADHDWRALAQAGQVAAIYMGKRSARFVQGRLLMHGADAAMPVSVVENVSRSDTCVRSATLADLPDVLQGIEGPAVILLGLAPRAAAEFIEYNPQLREQV
ncbi:uroporphyrinogen-III C-methyltransferase [Actibacterium atlanticum]|uniref:Uroporphyrinogen-III C-methyltransferase n=1 Tax=Actibacterium atlanticum TaxID=1461693 RepID=A0A058ZNN7_9RHOB|nr:siroheme synthase CysG [Actibacterium atlanticum]KCV82835.1 uroporphyrinogen-III C-methyltransferase [Actibacterium atlanticum]